MARKDEKTNITGTPAGEQTPARSKARPGELKDVDEHIAALGLPVWKGRSIKTFVGWKSGKMVTAEEFKAVIAAWNNRQQGTGRRG